MNSNTRKPELDLVLEQQIAALGAGISPEEDAKRFTLYVEATARAKASNSLMPDLPESIHQAVVRTLGAEYENPPYRGLTIPPEVTAACARRDIRAAAARGDFQGIASLYFQLFMI